MKILALFTKMNLIWHKNCSATVENSLNVIDIEFLQK
jgi:hypothetical protein